MTRTMTCDEVEALLPLVADGSLAAHQDPALFDHLATCSRCQESLYAHDLVGLALTQPAPRLTLRPPVATRRNWFVAAAALLLLGTGISSVIFALRPTAPIPVVAQHTPAADPTPVVDHTDPVIAVEAITLKGSSDSNPLYLIRRGNQVLMVNPPPVQIAAPTAENTAPSDTQPASYAVPQWY